MSQLFTQGNACIIGVGGHDIPRTIDDAVGIATILRDPERCAYPPEQVQLLTGKDATRARILAGLEHLVATTTSDSTVVVYFSGHGYKLKNPITGDLYFLLPHGYDEAALGDTAIMNSDFITRLRAIPARKLLLLLDCCHAGGMGDLSGQGFATEKSPLPPEAQALFEKGRGRVIVASSRADEVSLAGRPYSAFTLAVIDALAGEGASVQDGYVRVADLAMYAREVVPRRTAARQHPILHFEGADNFHLAYYAGGDAQPKGLPYQEEPEIESEPGAWNREKVEALGDRSFASTGNVTHSTVITGDGNIVGSANVVQIGQNNKYAKTMSDLDIGNPSIAHGALDPNDNSEG